MRSPWPAILAAAVTGATAAAPASAAKEAIAGYWMDSHGEVILEVGPCAEHYCAKVAWLQKPYGPDGKALRDFRNSDPALRDRLVCGMTVITGFTKKPDGSWGNGTVYVPDLGMSFSGYAEVLSPKQVNVRGYVLLPIFGESEVWTKVDGPKTGCLKE